MVTGSDTPQGFTRVGLVAIAVSLVVFAIPATRASFLIVPAILIAGLGFAFIGGASGPRASRNAAGAFAAYILFLFALFLVGTPFTYGSAQGPVFEKEEIAWAVTAFESGVQLIPIALFAGTAMAAWPWSPRAGRAILVTGLVLVVGFLVLDWLSSPASVDAAAGATVFGRWAGTLLSLAAVTLLAGVAVIVTPVKRLVDAARA